MFVSSREPVQRPAAGTSVPLVTSLTAAFGADGVAAAQLGPQRAGQHWHITRLVTTAGAAGDYVQLTVYRNFASPTNILDFTYQGVQATSETDITLLVGEVLVCSWTGGTPGSPAIIIVSGEILY